MSTAQRRAHLPGALSLSAALLLAGCKVGPDFSRPPAPVAEHWRDVTAPQATGAPADWWRLFEDQTLDALIERAYHGSLSLQVAAVRVLQAQAQLNIAIGQLFPQQQVLAGQAEYERQAKSTLLAPTLNPNLRTAQLGVSASWELDFWGKYRRGIESDRAAMLASLAAYDNALVTLTAQVASTYINVRVLQQRIQVAEENLKAQEESLRIARVQFENGATSDLDVQQATAELAETRAQVPQLRYTLVQAQDLLSILLGEPPAALDAQLAPQGAAVIPAAPQEVASGMPKDLLRRRPDVRQAEFTAAAQSAAIGIAKANLFPSFSLNGSFGFVGTSTFNNSPGQLFQWDNRNITAAGGFVFPILNYGRIVNAVRVQDAAFQQAVLSYQGTVLQAEQEVEDARSAFANAQVSLEQLTVAAAAARRSLELALDSYKEGATDYTTVLTAEQAQLRVEDALASARGNVPLGLVSVYRALGGGWQLRRGQPLLPEELRRQMQQRTNWGSLPDATGRLPDTEQPGPEDDTRAPQ